MPNKSSVVVWASIDPECVKNRIRRVTEVIEAVLKKYDSPNDSRGNSAVDDSS